MYYVYILKSLKVGKWYIGSSDNPERRLIEHNKGTTQSTKPYIPYKIIYKEEYENKQNAINREKQIKRSGIIRKELKRKIMASSSSPV